MRHRKTPSTCSRRLTAPCTPPRRQSSPPGRHLRSGTPVALRGPHASTSTWGEWRPGIPFSAARLRPSQLRAHQPVALTPAGLAGLPTPNAQSGNQKLERARQDSNLRPLAPEAHLAGPKKGGVCRDKGYIWASLKRANMARFGRDWAGFRHWCLNSRRSLVRTRSRCAGDAASATGGTAAGGRR